MLNTKEKNWINNIVLTKLLNNHIYYSKTTYLKKIQKKYFDPKTRQSC